MRLRLLIATFALLLPSLACAQSQPAKTHGPAKALGARVYSDAGNIFIERNGIKTQLTTSEQDVDPVLSPNGETVVYTRQGRGRSVRGYDLGQFCNPTPRPDQLRQVNIDGTSDRLLLQGHKGEAEQQLCDFRSKQFSSDGRRLYFLSPSWATSGALHVYDTSAREVRFLLPANDLLVLNFCLGKYKDHLVVESHRYFVFGGSYDWYWLYDPTGKRELGPIGPVAGPDELVRLAHEEWCKN